MKWTLVDLPTLEASEENSDEVAESTDESDEVRLLVDMVRDRSIVDSVSQWYGEPLKHDGEKRGFSLG